MPELLKLIALCLRTKTDQVTSNGVSVKYVHRTGRRLNHMVVIADKVTLRAHRYGESYDVDIPGRSASWHDRLPEATRRIHAFV